MPSNDRIDEYSTYISQISSGASLNIAYGNTAPSDTNKLWIKGSEANNLILISGNPEPAWQDTISTLSTTLPEKVDGMGTAAVGTKIYLFGGYNGNKLNTIQVFDTTNNTTSTLSTTLPLTADNIETAAVGTKIYLFGGVDSSYNILNTINVFSPRIYLNPNNILITEGQQENIFKLLSSPTQVEISIKNVYRGNSSNVAELNDAYLYNGSVWLNVNE